MLVGDLSVAGEMWDASEFTSDLVVDEDEDIGGENDLAILERDSLCLGEEACLDSSISLSITLDTLSHLELFMKLK